MILRLRRSRQTNSKEACIGCNDFLDSINSTTAQCLMKLAKLPADAKAGALLVTALDEIAWLLNLRGSDISYNPVFVSYVILTFDSATLYVDKSKVRLHSAQLWRDIIRMYCCERKSF